MPPPKPARTKRNVLLDLLRQTETPTYSALDAQPGTNARVNRALNEYVRAPRGSLNMDRRLGSSSFTLRFLLETLAEKEFPQLQRWYHRVPNKCDLRHPNGPLQAWAGCTFRDIQLLRRRGEQYVNYWKRTSVSRNASWLQRYMTHHALRAPALPLKARHTPLFRGVVLTQAQQEQLAKDGRWSDRGFMSFTRRESSATTFGLGSESGRLVVFRLKLSDVAPGTPWVWLVGTEEREAFPAIKQWGRRNGWEAIGLEDEHEVTLPPGTLRVKAASNKSTTIIHRRIPYTLLDVAFTPAPEFAWKPRRKGTRESNSNILWNIFANEPVTRKRARQPSQPVQPSRKPRVCTGGRCAIT